MDAGRLLLEARVTIDVRPHPDAAQWWMAWCERCQDWVRDGFGVPVSSPSQASVSGLGAEHMRDAHTDGR